MVPSRVSCGVDHLFDDVDVRNAVLSLTKEHFVLVSERVVVDGSVSRTKMHLVEEMEFLPQDDLMSGVPERAGKDTTGELVNDLVVQVQGQFFERTVSGCSSEVESRSTRCPRSR